LVANGISELKKKRSILLLILILSACIYSISNNYSREVEDWRGAVEFINGNWMKGDEIIFDREYVKKPFFYYVMKWNLSFQTDMVESEGSNRRVWLVISHTTPNQSQMKAMLDESYTQMDFKEFRGIQVYLYTASISDQ